MSLPLDWRKFLALRQWGHPEMLYTVTWPLSASAPELRLFSMRAKQASSRQKRRKKVRRSCSLALTDHIAFRLSRTAHVLQSWVACIELLIVVQQSDQIKPSTVLLLFCFTVFPSLSQLSSSPPAHSLIALPNCLCSINTWRKKWARQRRYLLISQCNTLQISQSELQQWWHSGQLLLR